MRTVRIISRRTFGSVARSSTAVFAAAAFLVFAGALFAHGLFAAEGLRASVAEVWARAAAWVLPALTALASMGVWTGAREDGRLDLLLATPVTERAAFAGSVLGAYAFVAVVLAAFAALPAFALGRWAPQLAPQLTPGDFLPAYAGLMLEALLWTAAGCLASACCRTAGAAALATLAITAALPYGAFRAALQWSPALRARWAEFPCAAHAADFASAYATLGELAFYTVFTLFALFAGAKALAARRFATSRGLMGLKASTLAAVASAFVFSALAFACAVRFDRAFDLSWGTRGPGFSVRTRQILADGRGTAHVTCFLSRASREFLSTARLLRQFASAARSVGGAEIDVRFVDPRWDLGEATRLVREGVPEGSLEFARGRRRVVVSVAEADESSCASALLRLSLPARRETVYWTTGHGEADSASHDAVFGLSDFVRALRQAGYRSAPLPADAPWPDNCAAIAVVGARTAFSPTEEARLDAYLKKGGRLFVLGTAERAGVDGLLARWGISFRSRGAGSGAAAAAFVDHAVTRPLVGTRVLFSDGAAAVAGEGVAPLVKDGAGAALAAALERGGGGDDLALRPTRIVVAGDPAFALNGALAARANANLDFLLNAFAWLSGLDASTAAGVGSDVLAAGLDARGWLVVGGVSSAGWPVALLLPWMLWRAWRRRKGAA